MEKVFKIKITADISSPDIEKAFSEFMESVTKTDIADTYEEWIETFTIDFEEQVLNDWKVEVLDD